MKKNEEKENLELGPNENSLEKKIIFNVQSK
jgi:hypothetical protein